MLEGQGVKHACYVQGVFLGDPGTIQSLFHTPSTIHCLKDIIKMDKRRRTVVKENVLEHLVLQHLAPRLSLVSFFLMHCSLYLNFFQNNPFIYTYEYFSQWIFIALKIRTIKNCIKFV